MADQHLPETTAEKLHKMQAPEIKEGPLVDLSRAIQDHEKANSQKSWLDKSVELVYNKEHESLENLKNLQRQAQQNDATGNTGAQSQLARVAKDAIQKDQAAVNHQREVDFYAGAFVKAVPLFAMTKGKVLFEGAAPSKGTVMLAASIGVNAADQVKVSDRGSDVAINAALGGAKGFLLKQTFDYLGPRQLLDASRGEYGNMAVKGMMLGGSSRLYETALNQNTYKDAKTGDWAVASGIGKVASTTLDPRSVAFDATLFAAGHGIFKGLSTATGRAVEASPALSKIAQSPASVFLKEGQVLQNAGMGGTFGFASGSTSELMRQREAGEDLNVTEIIRRGALQSLTDAAAGATGATGVQATRAVGHMKLEIPAPRPMTPSRAFAGDEAPLLPGEPARPDAAPPARAGDAVEPAKSDATAPARAAEATEPAKPADVVEPARAADAQAQARPDAVTERSASAALPEEQVKVSLEGTNGPHVETPLEAAADVKSLVGGEVGVARRASYEMSAAQKPIFEEGVRLMAGVFSGRASASDVTNFLQFGATNGQAVRPQLEQMARDYKELGNINAQRLLEVAVASTPETVAQAGKGFELAKAAASGERFGPEHQQLIEFAYGEGRGAQDTVRIVSELVGDPPANQLLGEVYSGANNLVRGNGVQQDIFYGNADPFAKESLEAIIAHQPTNAAEHNALMQGISNWADYFTADHSVLHQLGRTTPYGVVAAAVDAKLNTDYFSQFPRSHVIERPAVANPTPMVPDGQAVDLDALSQAAKPTPGVVKEVDPAQPVEASGPARDQTQPQPVEPAQPAQPADGRVERNTTDGPAVDFTPGKIKVYPERLWNEFENTTGPTKMSRARIIADHLGALSDAQFVDWLRYLHSPAQGTSGPTNLQRMGLAGSHILARPEIAAVVTNPDAAAIDVTTLKALMTQPAKPQSGALPESVEHHIAYRLQVATEQQRVALDQKQADYNANLPPGEAPSVGELPLDYPGIFRDAIPSWYARSLRDTYSTRNPQTGKFEYPADFNENLSLWLEIGREADMASPRYKEFPPQRNNLSDRLAVLEQAMTVRNATNAQAVDRILQLAGQDQPAAKGLLDKFDGTKNAPETAELIGLVAGQAKSIGEVKTVMDAVFFGKKADSDSFKGRKDGRDTTQSDKTRDSNLALAQSMLAGVMDTASPQYTRAQKLVNDMIHGQIRDPRPESPDRPGFGGRPGQDRGNDRGPRNNDRGGQDRGNDRGGSQGGRDNGRGPRRDVAPAAEAPAAPAQQVPFTRPQRQSAVAPQPESAVARVAPAEQVQAAVTPEAVSPEAVSPQAVSPEAALPTGPAVAAETSAQPSLKDVMTGTVTADNAQVTSPDARPDGTDGGASQVDRFNARYGSMGRQGKGRQSGGDEEVGRDGLTAEERGRKKDKPRGRVVRSFEDLGRLRDD